MLYSFILPLVHIVRTFLRISLILSKWADRRFLFFIDALWLVLWSIQQKYCRTFSLTLSLINHRLLSQNPYAQLSIFLFVIILIHLKRVEKVLTIPLLIIVFLPCRNDLVLWTTLLRQKIIYSNTLLHFLSCTITSDMLYPITASLNFLNAPPCNSFVKKSANMHSVGQYKTCIVLVFTQSCTKKNLMSTWREFPIQELWPFTSILMALWLSWYNTFLFNL